MSDIKLDNFVKLKLTKKEKIFSNSTRPVTILFSKIPIDNKIKKTFISYDEIKNTNFSEEDTFIKKFAKLYFRNGGKYLRIEDYRLLKDANLDEIIFCFSEKAFENLESNDIVLIKNFISDLTELQSNKLTNKILIIPEKFKKINHLKNLVVKKLLPNDGEITPQYSEAYLTAPIAAYLSKLDVSKEIKDYSYTTEYYEPENETNVLLTTNLDVKKELEAKEKTNFNIKIGNNKIISIGGDTFTGENFVNSFVEIILHQNLTKVIFDTLVSKPKKSEILPKLMSQITQELKKFSDSEYLQKNFIWKDNDWVKNYNGKEYTLVKEGELLPYGFKVNILPFSEISESDSSKKYCPPIFITLKTLSSIRYINIEGEID